MYESQSQRAMRNRASRRRLRLLGPGLALSCVFLLSGAARAATGAYGPWGDVDNNGSVDPTDTALVTAYLANPGSLSASVRERIRRYGDVSGGVNQNFIGNNIIDTQDAQRMAIIGGGIIDAGTAGAAPAGYGDVNGDGEIGIVDAVITQRQVSGLSAAPADAVRLAQANVGDISPTTPYVSFGNGVVDASDLAVITARAGGAETTPPAYTDYWPMHLPNLPGGSAQDTYLFTDINHQSGDFNYQTEYRTQAREEVGGITVTRVDGSDNTSVGVFKGQDGSIYAKYLQYPVAFQGKRITFTSPVKVLDAAAAAAGSGTWTNSVEADTTDFGVRPARIKGTVLFKENTVTPAAGAYPPASQWSKSVWVRLDVGLLAIPTSNFDMQQALFFDFAPFIGLVQRGQARLQGAAFAESNKPFTMLDDVTVRGIRYTASTP
jgi:hypothetical protein